jgi:hypothetical protein
VPFRCCATSARIRFLGFSIFAAAGRGGHCLCLLRTFLLARVYNLWLGRKRAELRRLGCCYGTNVCRQPRAVVLGVPAGWEREVGFVSSSSTPPATGTVTSKLRNNDRPFDGWMALDRPVGTRSASSNPKKATLCAILLCYFCATVFACCAHSY